MDGTNILAVQTTAALAPRCYLCMYDGSHIDIIITIFISSTIIDNQDPILVSILEPRHMDFLDDSYR